LDSRVKIKSSVRHTEGFLDLIGLKQAKVEASSHHQSWSSMKELKGRYNHKKTKKVREQTLLKSYEALYDSFRDQISHLEQEREKTLLKKRTSQAFATQILDEVDRVLSKITNRHIHLSLFLIVLMIFVNGLDAHLNHVHMSVFRSLGQFYIGLSILDVLKYKRIKRKLENVVDLTFSSDLDKIYEGLKGLEEVKRTCGYYGKKELDYVFLFLVTVDIALKLNHIMDIQNLI